MVLTDRIVNDVVKSKSTTTSNIATNIDMTNLLSIIEIPLLLEKVLEIVHCPILQDTMITPAYGKDGFLYDHIAIHRALNQKYASSMTREKMHLETDVRVDPTGVKLVAAIRKCRLVNETGKDLKKSLLICKRI